jgi:hypothetical protein
MSEKSPLQSLRPTRPAFWDMPWGEFTFRVVWIALRLILVGALAAPGSYFFYQGF